MDNLIDLHFSDVEPKNKARIMAAALRTFADNGYHAASIMNIAKKADVSKSLIYSHFESKEDLLIQIMIVVFEKFSEEYDFKQDLSYNDLLVYWAEKSFELIDDYPDIVKMYISLTIQKDVSKIMEPHLLEMLGPLIKDMGDSLKIADPKKAMDEIVFLGAVLDGLSLNYLYNKDFFPKEYVIKRIRETFINKPK